MQRAKPFTGPSGHSIGHKWIIPPVIQLHVFQNLEHLLRSYILQPQCRLNGSDLDFFVTILQESPTAMMSVYPHLIPSAQMPAYNLSKAFSVMLHSFIVRLRLCSSAAFRSSATRCWFFWCCTTAPPRTRLLPLAFRPSPGLSEKTMNLS